MTHEEAIKRIKKRICCEKPTAHFCTDNCMHGREECEIAMAMDAIEKQIPKKPHKYHYPQIIKKGVCPHCLQTEDDSANYCRACGQALDWSE